LGQLAADSPLAWAAQLRMAQNLDVLGQTDKATQMLADLSAKHPDHPDAAVALGDLYRWHEHWPEAIKAYDTALAEVGTPNPSDWRIYYARGIAYDSSKDWTRAEADMKKALELSPSQPEVLNYLGYSWVDRGMNVEQARQMIEKAVAQNPS